MKRIFPISLFFLLCSISLAFAQQPNIIFIFADDLGYGELGCYGQQKIETPNLDALAAKGKKFTSFYSGTSVCAPSRASLMTGLHTGHTPIRGNKQFAPEGQTPLPASTKTFANYLQQRGYATATFGKWGMGFNQNSGDPNKKGFDLFYGYNDQSLAHDFYPPYLWKNHDKVDLSINKQYDSVYSAALIQQQALNYIQEQGSKPFFMYLSYTLPHGDVIGPHDSLYNYYKQKFNEQPLTGNALRTRPHNINPEPYPHAQFAAMVGRLDMYVGEIVKAIQEKGLAENTLIIFSSDNGPHRENGGDPEFFNSNGIYRGIKRDLYEGGMRVPFIAYWPNKIKPAVVTQPVALWDMYPTFLELAKVPVEEKIDGISIVPLLTQNKGKQKLHDFFYWEFHENDGRQAVRWGKWKGVRLGVSKNENAPIELYNLNNDPSEQRNVADKNPEVIKVIEQIMKQEHVYNLDWPLLSSEFKKQHTN
ncbi:MAG: arylsulfatase [Chitinophagaceae bacterium]|nr:arylsulfatase [Chitinophagaceae bacterium]